MKKVLCIGGVTVDIVVRPVERLPEAGTLAVVSQTAAYVGGCAANAAIDLGRLGVPASICCRVGKDLFGNFVLRELEDNHVRTAGVVTDPSVGTSSSVVAVNGAGERSFLYYPGSTSELNVADISEEMLEAHDIVFLASALLLPGLDGAGAAALLKRARSMGKYTVMDTAWDFEGRWMEKLRDSLPYLDLFMPSLEEAEKLAGTSSLDGIADCFLELGAKNVIIKTGETGAYICEAGGERYVSPSFPLEKPVDTNGAGDAFCAGFLCGLARGWDYRRSAEFANAVGSHCVMGSGAYSGIVPMERIDDFLGNRTSSSGKG